MELSFRRVAGRAVLAAGVCAAAILALRGPEDRREVTYVVDPRPLGAAVRNLDVTITVGETVAASLTARITPDRPLSPLRLVTPVPSAPVTITIDVVTVDGSRRIEHAATPPAGSTVTVTVGE